MACNCKKKIEIEKKYGVPQEEGILGVVIRYVSRIVLALIVLALFVIIFPLITCVLLYQVLMGKELEVSLPKFFSKRLVK